MVLLLLRVWVGEGAEEIYILSALTASAETSCNPAAIRCSHPIETNRVAAAMGSSRIKTDGAGTTGRLR